MEDYYEYLDSNGVTTLYKLIKDDTVALIDSYSVTVNGITTTLDTHINDSDIHTPISVIEGMIDTRISGLVNSAPETLDTLKELSDALGNDPNFATTIANQIGNKADKDTVYTKLETDALLENKANSVHTHVVSDITDFPTIPTKLSQLENDMGFGTGGGSGDTSDCVHKTGNETISGIKTFNDAIVQKKDGYISNDNIDNTITPSSNLFTHFFFSDKNNIASSFIRYAQRTNGFNEINLFVRDKDLNNYGVSLNTNNEFIPVLNNTYSLGSSSLKWANIYGTNAYIDKVTCTRFTHSVNNGSVYITGGSEYDKGATLVLHGEESSDAGSFIIKSRDKTRSLYLVGKPDGTLEWGGQDIALDGNLVHKSGDEYVDGNKVFRNAITVYNNIYRRNNNADLTSPPTNGAFTQYMFIDKNSQVLGYVEHAQRNTNVNDIGLWVKDKDSNTHGVRITSNKEFLPGVNNTYSSGSSSVKWLSVYATTYYGNLVGSITLNQATLKMTVKDSNSGTTRTNDVILANSSNTSYGINVAFGGSGNTVVGAGESYTAQLNELAGNSQKNLYLTADNNIYFKVGANTFADAKTVTLNTSAELSGLAKVTATTFVGALSGNASTATSATTATKSTTQANTDNSTNIATTAWVRTYVNSVVGSGSVGASISAYYSNATTVTATGSTTGHSALYPADYSDYVNVAPTVGTIYTGSQLFSSFTPTASGTINKLTQGSSSVVYQTTASAKATFSGAFSSSAKYLCTTANAVKFRAYVSQGTPSTMGSPSVVDQSSAKSIFIRVQ